MHASRNTRLALGLLALLPRPEPSLVKVGTQLIAGPKVPLLVEVGTSKAAIPRSRTGLEEASLGTAPIAPIGANDGSKVPAHTLVKVFTYIRVRVRRKAPPLVAASLHG